MTFAVDMTIRVSLMLLISLLAVWLFRRRSAAMRHWLLVIGIACAAATPVIQALLPAWRMDAVTASPESIPTAPEAAVVSMNRAIVADRPGDVATAQAENPRMRSGLWLAIALVWTGGAVLSGAVLLVGLRRLSRAAAEAGPADARWLRLADEIGEAIGLRRRVTLLQSADPTLLVTWGVARPRILLPAGADRWSEDRARIVLWHELAHIRRHDWLAQMVAEVLRAPYWFNPLVWIACRRLRDESEHACDDEVLNGGVGAAEYASQLVDLARLLSAAPSTGPALAMARPSTLHGRVTAMLNTRLNHRPLSGFARAASAIALAALAIPLAIAAQGRYATVSGTVVDPTGRFVADARLVLTDTARDAKYEVRSDGTGRFTFLGVTPGDYRLEVERPGFRKFVESVAVRGDMNRSIALQVGKVQETVTVMAGTAPSAAAPRDPAQEARARARVEAARRAYAERCAGATPGEMGGDLVPPMKVLDVRVAYPESMRGTGQAGIVTLDTTIGTDGKVRVVQTVASPGPEFEAAAINAVRQWEFTPTYLNCTPTEVQMQVTVRFVPEP